MPIQDTVMGSFRRLGEGIATYPKTTLCGGMSLVMAFALAFLLSVLEVGAGTVTLVTDVEELWTMRGGRLEEELNFFHEHYTKERELSVLNLLMVTGKPDADGNEGDVLTREAIAEIFEVEKKIMSFSVKTTASDVEYGFEDLCAKEIAPISPFVPGAVAGPCGLSSVTQCFGDNTYRTAPAAEGFMAWSQTLPWYNEYYGLVPYAQKPLLADEDPHRVVETGMMEEETQDWTSGKAGCIGTSRHFKLPIDAILGGVERDAEGRIVKAKAAQVGFSLDAWVRAEYRESLMRPEMYGENSYVDFQEAKELWVRQFLKEVAKIQEGGTLKHIDISPLGEKSGEEYLKEKAKPDWAKLITGGFLMSFVVFVMLVHPRDSSQSHVTVGMTGVGLVSLATAAGFGLVQASGVKLNFTMVQTLPFLALGIGVDDMFLLVQYFRTEANKASRTEQDVIGCVLMKGGSSVTLTSLCNILSFLVASNIPILAMQSFCWGAATIVGFNWVMMFFVFPALLVFEQRRIKAGRFDVPWVRNTSVQVLRSVGDGSTASQGQVNVRPETVAAAESVLGGSAADDAKKDMKAMQRFTEHKISPLLQTRGAQMCLSLLAIGMCAVGAGVAPMVEMGYAAEDLVEDTHIMYHFLKAKFKYFNMWPVFVVTKDTFDFPSQQSDLIALYDELLTMPETVMSGSDVWATNFYRYVQAREDTAHLLEVPNPTDPNDADAVARLAPAGVCPTDRFNELFFDFALRPEEALFANPMDPVAGSFVSADSAGISSWALDAQNKKVLMSMHLLWTRVGDGAVDDTLKTVNMYRSAFEDSGLSDVAYPFGVPFTYYEQYLDLWSRFWSSFAASAAIVLVVSSIFLFSPVAGLAVSLFSVAIVLELIALFYFMGNKFNVYAAGTIVSSIGLSLEATAHVAAAYVFSKSRTPNGKLHECVSKTFLPVLEGSLSTFAGLAPLLFVRIPAVKIYFGTMFMAAVALSLVNGAVLMPACMACVDNLRNGKNGRRPQQSGSTVAPAPIENA